MTGVVCDAPVRTASAGKAGVESNMNFCELHRRLSGSAAGPA
jgi:hypothetical protein